LTNTNHSHMPVDPTTQPTASGRGGGRKISANPVTSITNLYRPSTTRSNWKPTSTKRASRRNSLPKQTTPPARMETRSRSRSHPTTTFRGGGSVANNQVRVRIRSESDNTHPFTPYKPTHRQTKS